MKVSFVVICQIWLAACSSGGHLIKDFHQPPRAWTEVGPAPEDEIINLKIGLAQRDFPELERQLYEVSNPRHARYGQYLSSEAVRDLVSPSLDTRRAVETWLEDAGFEAFRWQYNSARTWILMPVSVAEAEALLQTRYSVWEHEDGTQLVRTQSWSLPVEIHDRITTIQPTNSWARLKQRLPIVKPRSSYALKAPDSLPDIPIPSEGRVAGLCNFSAVSPDCLRLLYGTASYTAASNGRAKLGLTNYLGEYNNRSDTEQFLNKYRPEAAQAALTFPQISVAGGYVDNGTNTAGSEPNTAFEGNLDVQYMLGIGYPLPLTAWSTGGEPPGFQPSLSTPTNTDEPYLTWTNYILSQPDIPQIISASYGDDEQTVSPSYAMAVCNEFAQITAQGVTLLFASGDSGVGPDGACVSNKDNTTEMFIPEFPSSCPFVTSVGGTKNFPEVAAEIIRGGEVFFSSGAGFSNYFGAPSYQQDTVGKYVSGLNGLYDGLYNRSGRAYPDISCIGQYLPVIWNGSQVRLVGTSAATPICAAVLGFANDALLAAGRPPLGFLNPWLYSGGYNAFTDVTNGSSSGCNTTGFPATQGWDAVTGFGTPYLPAILKELVL